VTESDKRSSLQRYGGNNAIERFVLEAQGVTHLAPVLSVGGQLGRGLPALLVLGHDHPRRGERHLG